MVNWKAADAFERLVGALIASNPGMRLDYNAIAIMYSRGATYDAIESRFRKFRKIADQLRAEATVNGVEMPTSRGRNAGGTGTGTAPSTPRTPRTRAPKNGISRSGGGSAKGKKFDAKMLSTPTKNGSGGALSTLGREFLDAIAVDVDADEDEDEDGNENESASVSTVPLVKDEPGSGSGSGSGSRSRSSEKDLCRVMDMDLIKPEHATGTIDRRSHHDDDRKVRIKTEMSGDDEEVYLFGHGHGHGQTGKTGQSSFANSHANAYVDGSAADLGRFGIDIDMGDLYFDDAHGHVQHVQHGHAHDHYGHGVDLYADMA